MRLPIGIIKGTGLVIQNPESTPIYQPQRAGHGDLHLYWQAVYQDVIRSVGPLAAFLPSATFEGSGEKVVFSHIEDGTDILSLTRPLSRSEGIPDDVLRRLDSAIKSFKAIAHRDGTSPDVRRFVEEFTLPSITRFPEAYRVYQPGLLSTRRYFILWGFEPVGVSNLTRDDIGQIQVELQKRSTSTDDYLGFAARALAMVCGLAVVSWLIAYALLPRPEAKFSVVAEEGKMAIVHNLSIVQKTLGVTFGDTSYLWSFEDATTATSDRFNPEPTWPSRGSKTVRLTATHSSVLWLSKSHSSESKVEVSAAPVIPPLDLEYGEKLPDVLPRPPDPREPNVSNNDPKNGSTKDRAGDRSVDDNDEVSRGSVAKPNDQIDRERREGNGEGVGSKREGSSAEAGITDSKSQQGQQGTNQERISRQTTRRGGSTEPRPPEVIPIAGGAKILWFNSRAEGVDSKRLWVSLEIEVPEGYNVSRVSFDGKSRSYVGRFEQLVNIGPNNIDIELSGVSASDGVRILKGIIQFNRPFDVIEQPSGPAIPRRDGGGLNQPPEPFDPKKAPDLSPSESA